MSSSLVAEQHKGCPKRRGEVESDEPTGRPVAARAEREVQKIIEIVWKDLHLRIPRISNMGNINK